MKVAITGSLYRPGGESNIVWLYTAIHRFFPKASLVRARPLPWDEWVSHRLHAVESYRQILGEYDLVIGFELPPAAQQACKKWVSVDLHPHRWGMPMWSVQANFLITRPKYHYPRPILHKEKSPPTETCFTTQVSSDATLLDGVNLILAEHRIAEITAKLSTYQRVWVVPHPLEPNGPWVTALLTMPNALLYPGTAYEAMEEMQTMWTISSSTGHEAPFFKCAPNFLGTPKVYSDPVDITDPRLWEVILDFWRAQESK